MANVSVLENRIMHEIPEEYHEDIEREFARFEFETARMPEEIESDKAGQASLTDREIERTPTTNQHGDNGFTVVQLQAIKAKAIQNDVSDWTKKIDKTLTYEENKQLMEREYHGR